MTERQPKLYDAMIETDAACIEKVTAFNQAWEALCKALEAMLPSTTSNQPHAASLLLMHVVDSYWIYCQNSGIDEDDAVADVAQMIAQALMKGLTPESLVIPEILRTANIMNVRLDQDDIWIGTLLGCHGNPTRQRAVLVSWFKALPSAWHEVFGRQDDENMSEEDHVQATKSVIRRYQEMLEERDAQKRMH